MNSSDEIDRDTRLAKTNFSHYKCFADFELDFRNKDGSIAQWTVLLGENNAGKTNILRAIAGMSANKNEINAKGQGESGYYMPKFHSFGELRNGLAEDTAVECQLVIYGENIKDIWGIAGNSVYTARDEHYAELKIYGYGVGRYTSRGSLSENRCGDSDTLFYPDKRLINLDEWLMQADYAVKNEGSRLSAERLDKIIALIRSDLFPDIRGMSFRSVEGPHGIDNYPEFMTDQGAFRYNELDYGYQSMLSWVIDFCSRMFKRYPTSDNPLHESAIVLLDEIDLHLHPRWQREVISRLSRLFPHTQFIATTHSPLVLQSMAEVNLYVLSKEDDGRISVTREAQTDFSGLSVEEILRHTLKLNDEVNSDLYNQRIKKFRQGVHDSDVAMAQQAYLELEKTLRPENPVLELLRMELEDLKADVAAATGQVTVKKLKLPPKPAELTAQQEAKLVHQYLSTGKKVWREPYIVTALKRAGRYCAYTEQRLNEQSAYLEAEHYYCKSLHTNKVVQWGNLLPCCKAANVKKGELDVAVTPLINPYCDDPCDYLAVSHFNYLPRNGSQRGKDAILHCDLNNAQLFGEPRKRIGESIAASLHDNLDLLKHEVPQGTSAAQTVMGHPGKIKRRLQDARYGPYSAVISTFIRFESEVYSELKHYLQECGLWDDELKTLDDEMASIALPLDAVLMTNRP